MSSCFQRLRILGFLIPKLGLNLSEWHCPSFIEIQLQLKVLDFQGTAIFRLKGTVNILPLELEWCECCFKN